MSTILCIDTDEQYARHICTHLKNAGHICICSKSGKEVISLIEKHGVDLILSEVMLPDVCGFEISRRLRSHPDHFMLPIVLMSSMAEEDEIKHGYAQGVDVYLPKPVDPLTLTSCISQKIAEAQAASSEDPLTGLYSSKRIKASVQRAITLRQKFALVYIEMLGITNFVRIHGVESRDKALRQMARLIRKWGEQSETGLFEASHMGAGHFVCLMAPEKTKSFCKDLHAGWENHLPKFYEALKGPHGATAAMSKAVPDLTLMICATGSGVAGAHSTNDYFDTLAQLRNKALANGKGGVYTDHRRNV